MTDVMPGGLAELEACHTKLLSWCDFLEAIADFLPCHVDNALCATMARELGPLLAETHRLEERLICSALPLIAKAAEIANLRELRAACRAAELDAAQQAIAALTGLAAGRSQLSPGAVGQALRLFSGPMRRQIKLERQMLCDIRMAAAKAEQRPVRHRELEADGV
ncbi:hypothetical protein [Rhizobium sp. Rhizsp82]|uniref:hypothetical protein n=1 Tax=Rhizobium sp. Rhizsp82 TaxID=3243057 RepID=UPI0039B62498